MTHNIYPTPPSVYDESAWLPWEPSSQIIFKTRDIFVLATLGRQANGIYLMESFNDSGISYLAKYIANNKWESSHAWDFSDSRTTIRLLKASLNVKSQQSKTGAICTRCNSINPWAGPNQKDGSYICFECR